MAVKTVLRAAVLRRIPTAAIGGKLRRWNANRDGFQPLRSVVVLEPSHWVMQARQSANLKRLSEGGQRLTSSVARDPSHLIRRATCLTYQCCQGVSTAGP